MMARPKSMFVCSESWEISEPRITYYINSVEQSLFLTHMPLC